MRRTFGVLVMFCVNLGVSYQYAFHIHKPKSHTLVRFYYILMILNLCPNQKLKSKRGGGKTKKHV